jgi:hypothetical protein
MATRVVGLVALAVAVLGSPAKLMGAEGPEADALKELDARIAERLERDQFSQASRQLIKTFWQEYREAFLKNERKMDGSWPRDAEPDIKSYDEYLGFYASEAPQRRGLSLEVATDARGRFLVKLEGHELPSVPCNRGILFTSGDFVYSDLPTLGQKPHATLELMLLVRIGGKYALTKPGRSSAAFPLTKQAGK